ncbi:tryptophan--tRNA ligase [Candidatus Woesearchaeota archaeon]|nr:tryptophan--tRNA ligase [Candidatus Woesearchaeota archaeon]
MNSNILLDNEKLVKNFGARPISEIAILPDFYTFKKGLVYSHRDFDKFMAALNNGEKCAIVSGFNPSGTIHLGHKVVFDTNLFFQKKYGVSVFIPISDDESYIVGKVKDQKQGLEFAMQLAKELLAYGFDSKKTYFIIDQVYTNIYNLAIKLCPKVTLSEIKASYGYGPEDNPGMYFYPVIQSAHILLPIESFGFKQVLVPIGPDEDPHIRVCRDIAARASYNKPAILHMKFMPGLTGDKMSASKPNTAIFLNEPEKSIRIKVNKAFSGGKETVDEHRKNGGNPEIDIPCIYLTNYFYDEKQSKKLVEDYKKGKLLSGEVKKLLADELIIMTTEFQTRIKKVTDKQLEKVILKNKNV